MNRIRLGFVQFLKHRFVSERPLHPVDRRLAKQWIKKRLVVVFPELRNDPKALEQVYHQLDLEPRPGTRNGEACFELMAGTDDL